MSDLHNELAKRAQKSTLSLVTAIMAVCEDQEEVGAAMDGILAAAATVLWAHRPETYSLPDVIEHWNLRGERYLTMSATNEREGLN